MNLLKIQNFDVDYKTQELKNKKHSFLLITQRIKLTQNLSITITLKNAQLMSLLDIALYKTLLFPIPNCNHTYLL